LRFEELPKIPPNWFDFLNSKLTFLPAFYELPVPSERIDVIGRRMAKNEVFHKLIDELASEFAQAPDNLQRLSQPGAVAVTTCLRGSLFGGPLSQTLKCFTTIRACEELAIYGVKAVPVGWFVETSPAGFPVDSIQLLDQESEIHLLQIRKSEEAGAASGAPFSWNRMEELLLQIEALGRGTFDRRVLDEIRSAFVQGATLSSASANLLTGLMKEWGMIFLDAGKPWVQSVLTSMGDAIQGGAVEAISPLSAQNLVMPAIACVADPFEVQAYGHMLRQFDEHDLPKPMIWPQCSATITDSRSRRILSRLNLDLDQLYSGEESIVTEIRNAMPRAPLEKLEGLKSEARMRMDTASALCLPESEFAKTADACTNKIVYQLQKLLDRCRETQKNRERVIRRQIHKVCNFLAPNGSLQEMELGGIQIPLRYSRGGLRSLHQKLDIRNLEHQIISLD
jgi:uncharacterized protein YllA (UPF0747 family)